MKLLVDEMPYYKDDCMFSYQKWNGDKGTWVNYCKFTDEECTLDLNEQECDFLKAVNHKDQRDNDCEAHDNDLLNFLIQHNNEIDEEIIIKIWDKVKESQGFNNEEMEQFVWNCFKNAKAMIYSVKDEPQLTPNYCGTCKHREVPCGDLPCDVCHGYSNYEQTDEPQTERSE